MHSTLLDISVLVHLISVTYIRLEKVSSNHKPLVVSVFVSQPLVTITTARDGGLEMTIKCAIDPFKFTYQEFVSYDFLS